jgi:hypothetical protein
MTEEDTSPRYGVVAHRSRLGGARNYVYLDQPTPYVIGGPVSSVFSQIFREEWFSLPKGAHLQWAAKSTLDLVDLGFLTPAALLSIAWVWSLCHKRGSSCSTPIS